MTGPRMMTAAEYLAARGWAEDEGNSPGSCCYWLHANVYGGPAPTDTAITIQRARDAEEERDLYRRTFAACVANAEHFTFNDADLTAQKAVDRYRARFAIEVES